MPNKRIIAKIQKHRLHLNSLGVKSLAVFGSVARGEARKDSDVDILVEFDGAVTFDRFMDTKFYLEELLGRPVDLVIQKALKPRMKTRIGQDLVYVA
jgi:predicted nucleotidyltransferase